LLANHLIRSLLGGIRSSLSRSNRRETVNGREALRPAAAGHSLKPLALYGKHQIFEAATIEGAVLLEFPMIEAPKP
jgi:hypothetical protein